MSKIISDTVFLKHWNLIKIMSDFSHFEWYIYKQDTYTHCTLLRAHVIVSGIWAFTAENFATEHKFAPAVIFHLFLDVGVPSPALRAEVVAGVVAGGVRVTLSSHRSEIAKRHAPNAVVWRVVEVDQLVVAALWEMEVAAWADNLIPLCLTGVVGKVVVLYAAGYCGELRELVLTGEHCARSRDTYTATHIGILIYILDHLQVTEAQDR